jgi:DNA-binding PadR family transcriptional regulator
MYICFQMRVLWASQKKKNEKITVVKGSLNHYHEITEENGKMYGYEITPKVKDYQGELNITEGLWSALHKLEAEGILDVEIEKVDNRMRKYYKLTEAGTKETVNRLMEDFIRKRRV